MIHQPVTSRSSRGVMVLAVVASASTLLVAIGVTWAMESSDSAQRSREGSQLVDQPGQFRMVGDRIAFEPQGDSRHMVCLENLSLERVEKVLRDHTEPVQWRVTATVTEYHGANYLLVRAAIIQRQPK